MWYNIIVLVGCILVLIGSSIIFLPIEQQIDVFSIIFIALFILCMIFIEKLWKNK